MGKRKLGYNWKARQHSEVTLDKSAEKKLKIDLTEVKKDEKYDDCNALVLPSEKRKTKKKLDSHNVVRKLSKKERKKLQKVLDQKQKKEKRAKLLESLSEVQATVDEINMLTSISEMHSGKSKPKQKTESIEEIPNIKTVGGSNRKRKTSVSDDAHTDSSIDTSDISTDEEDEEEEEDVSGIDRNTENAGIVIKCATSEQVVSESACEDKQTGDEKINDQESNKDAEKKQTVSEEVRKKFRETVHIPVNRLTEVQKSRQQLPILGEEQLVMETINENAVVIICGETGSGKTTQVPQFLYEAGYAHVNGIIGITEPRRVAAVSMSHRVAMEMNLSTREVSYQIRYEGNVTDDTKIKFMTDGVLLKEVQKDFLLQKYSVVIIDEAHERSVYTDILIGLLSRIVPLREKRGNTLKLIIMSATLRVEDFTQNNRLFKEIPPVVKVDSRQFPVTIHFNKITPLENYINETFRKVCKIHRMLPEGGILVFVTGQQELYLLCRKLKQTFPLKQNEEDKVVKNKNKKGLRGKNKKKTVEMAKKLVLPKINLESYSVEAVDEEAELEGEGYGDADGLGLDDIEEDILECDDAGGCTDPLYVLPLFSLLASDKQAKVFQPAPDGSRLCVVATNVAETSLTIPNIKYVVDTGKVKNRFYDKVTGVSTFKICWTSKAAANQRAGRAGRVSAGHCYRLYSSAVFNDEFAKFSPAEITRRPVDDLILQMKDMDIDKVINFPFPTSPDIAQLMAAEKLLVSLGALAQPGKPKTFKDTLKAPSTKVTSLGRTMACFPVSPRYAKMLTLGEQHGLLPYVVALVAALSVQELFVEVHSLPLASESDVFRQKIQHMMQIKKIWSGTGNSHLLGDLMILLKAVGSFEYEGGSPDFCEKHGIRYKAMKEVRKLRAQLTNTVNTVMSGPDISVNPKMEPPSDFQAKLLQQIVLAGLGDHVARKILVVATENDETKKKLKYAYQCSELEDPVFIHPSSVLYKETPMFVVYQYIQETSKLYMKGVVSVEPEWLPIFCPSHCNFSKPLTDPPAVFDEVKGQVKCHMTSTFGYCAWLMPAVQLDYPEGLDKYKLFAQFLLEGKVCKKLKKYVPTLLSLPTTMTKPWAKLQPRTEVILKALVNQSVNSKQALHAAWEHDPQYLMFAYSQWIPEVQHLELKDLWPPT